jgi:hypothetical protein
MTTIANSCPHCSAENSPGAAFCGSCGKAMPMRGSGPRVVNADQLPASSAGVKLVGDELSKKTRKAANTLLIVGILQWVVGVGVVLLIASTAPGGLGAIPMPRLVGALLPALISGAAFLGLYFWARISPLPATIVGVVIYCTLVAINVAVTVGNMGNNGGRGGGLGGIGIGWLDIIIIAVLAQGVSAAVQQRKLVNGVMQG